MSHRMVPIPTPQLMDWLFSEYEKQGSCFGVQKPYIKKDDKVLPLFREKLETPFGPAAGPNTQLAQNIIAAYFAGSRFFELKTVQKMDGEELAACVGRPCILAEDEGYNCEWSTELTVPDAMDEYVKAWFACRLIAKRWGLGSPEGFMFNISVGYDLAGIQTPKMDKFIEGMKDASGTPVYKECVEVLTAMFPEDAEFIRATPGRIVDGVTVSTLHGCPPSEIESITAYLMKEKHLNAFVKCNPTILGYDFARKTLDDMGYDYICFDDHHFKEDLQWADAVPMFRRLQELARSLGLEFGLKLSNTFPVDVTRGELPSGEMYMSGRAEYPLTIEMANRFATEFKGQLRISYSGGADYFNIQKLFAAGIWPITMATNILKPGGYGRMVQLGEALDGMEFRPFAGVDYEAVSRLALEARADKRHMKAIKSLPSRKLEQEVPLIDCYTAPCTHGCPIGQDIPEYIALSGKGMYKEALELITQKNPLPFITGTICAHRCMNKCTRNFYEESVKIRDTKLVCAEKGYEALMAELKAPGKVPGKKVAIVGGGPAGLAAAYFVARAGIPVTVFEKRQRLGGIVRNVIPGFRISDEAIEKDAALVARMGAEFKLGAEAPGLEELKAAGYTHILLAVGAEKPGTVRVEGNVINVIAFLEQFKNDPQGVKLGENVAVIGGGNTAMDAARAAKRAPGVKKVTLVYRRTKKFMPADAEELELAIQDGVEFMELVSPVSQKDGKLLCKVMKLGDPDASGRRAPVETHETAEVPADTVIAAVGEKLDEKVFAKYGVALDEKGRAPKSAGCVYVAGDALRGPATVVEAIADAQAFADAVIQAPYEYEIPAQANPCRDEARVKKTRIALPGKCEAERCLNCNAVCECCVSVCPNRCNVAVKVPGHVMRQILHLDYICNECGNCASFCPYASRPYRDKFTLFRNETDFMDSTNDGFMVICPKCPQVKVRLGGQVKDYDLGNPNDLDKNIEAFILTVIKDYAYLL